MCLTVTIKLEFMLDYLGIVEFSRKDILKDPGAISFSWDNKKNDANIKKDGISFNEEERFVLLG